MTGSGAAFPDWPAVLLVPVVLVASGAAPQTADASLADGGAALSDDPPADPAGCARASLASSGSRSGPARVFRIL